MEQKALRIGAAVLALALLLRLGGTRENLTEQVGKGLIFLSSGRMVSETIATVQPAQETETVPAATEAAVPVFGQSQESLVQVSGDWSGDTLALLQAPLHWDLKSQAPTVLILHTHATESYENTENYAETSPYRTLDENYNMLSIGDAVAERLEAGGVHVIHDRTLHDYPAYNDAYQNARQTIRSRLEENPSICLVLDLHRDAAEEANGTQKRETVELNGTPSARLMLVMGSDQGSLSHAQWQKNLSLAVKLQAQLEGSHPGLCRPIQLRASRYNQDLSTGALLVEVGTAGNTRQEALQAANYLAEGILSLARGANIQ